MDLKSSLNHAVELLNNIKAISNDTFDYPESIDSLAGAIKFAVFGSYSVGKSTFINAFAFKGRVLPANLGETTKKTVLFSYSQSSENLFNGEPFDFDKLEEYLTNSTKPFNEVHIKNEHLKDYTVVDIPGYGGIQENDLEEVIKKGCEQADAIFFVFDISKGLSGDDKEKSKNFISHFLKADSKTQIWIIFNKLDAESDKTEEQICKLISETLCSLELMGSDNILDSYEKLADKKAFAVSAKKALDGYCHCEIISGEEEAISAEQAEKYLKRSRMPFFKEKFDSSLENARKETFIFRLNKNISYICYELTTYENNLKQKIQQRDDLVRSLSEKADIKQEHIKFIDDTKLNITRDLSGIEDFLVYLDHNQRKVEIEKLKSELLEIYENCLLKSISKYQPIGGDSKEKLVEKGLKNGTTQAMPIMEKFVTNLITKFVNDHEKIQSHISTFNQRYNNPLIKLENINKQGNYDAKDGKFDNVSNAMFDEIAKEIAAVISAIIAGIVATFFETRLATLLIPGIGWALGAIGLAYSIWSAATIGEQIAKKVKPELRKSLYEGEFPVILTKTLHKQLIENHKVQAQNVIDIAKNNIQILSRMSAQNEDEKRAIENEMKKSLAEKNIEISHQETKISHIKENLEVLTNITTNVH